MTKESQTRKEIKQPDKVEVFFFEASDYIYRKKKLIFIILAVFVAALAAVYGGIRWMQSAEVKRLEKFYSVEQQVKNFSGELKDADGIIRSLDGFIQEYSDSPQAMLARFFKGKIYFEAKELDKAINAVGGLKFEGKDNATLGFMAGMFLANIYREQNKFDLALETLQNLDANALEDVKLMEIAQTHLMQGNQTQARETLQILINEHSNSEYKYQAEQMLATMPAE